MFGIEKSRLKINLEKIRSKLCSYVGNYCDCKYGKEDQEPSNRSERFSGCPELRQVLGILEVMTEEEFKEFCDRADISVGI